MGATVGDDLAIELQATEIRAVRLFFPAPGRGVCRKGRT